MKDGYVFLQNYFANDYRMLVRTPTHISGSTIDHIYAHRIILDKYEIKVEKKCLYFSDHDAIIMNVLLL